MSGETIPRERAERIARAQGCGNCGEYSFKKVVIKPASPEHQKEFNEAWHAVMLCGICGMHQEMGIDADGDVVYVNCG